MILTVMKTVIGRSIAAIIVAAMLFPSQSIAESHVIEIQGFVFSPAKLRLQSGDTVTWKNLDIVPHTATSLENIWDTGLIQPGESKSLVFDEIAIDEYFCVYHPNMRASLRVTE